MDGSKTVGCICVYEYYGINVTQLNRDLKPIWI